MSKFPVLGPICAYYQPVEGTDYVGDALLLLLLLFHFFTVELLIELDDQNYFNQAKLR